MKYYMDESGNTGDIINKKKDINFSNQPIFSHSCIGLSDENLIKIEAFSKALKEQFNIPIEQELKSEDYYFQNPRLIMLVALFLVDHNIPMICEVADKKHNISIAIVQNLIIPQTHEKETQEINVIRGILAEFLTEKAPEICFTNFMKMCQLKSEKSFFDLIDSLKLFFTEHNFDNGNSLRMLEMTIDDYNKIKYESSPENAVAYFMILPDYDSSGNEVKMLPLVFSFYNIIARLNKHHRKKLKDVTVFHDNTYEYSKTLEYCLNNISSRKLENKDYIQQSDYLIKEKFELKFIDSKNSIGVQIADIVAGFLQRYINGTIYKGIKVDEIYDDIFSLLINHNHIKNPLGVNFVLPFTRRHWLFHKFGLLKKAP